jgi:hypothetical protein
MDKPKGIFWLSSYPKSGNTWFRIVLANLLNTTSKPVDLNELQTGSIASARGWVDQVLGFDSADLDHDEIDQLRPAIYKWLGEQLNETGYHKIHDAYTYLNESTPLIPTDGCLGAIYFIRNPLDVAISFANHSNCSIDEAINLMGKPQYAFCKSKYKQPVQLRQKLLSWSLHVHSWTTVPDFNVLVLRYEDMKLTPLKTFTQAIRFLQLNSSSDDIAKALDNAHIDKLQLQEEQSGFHERPAKVARFFRKGIVGDWQTTLSITQIKRIINDHGELMKKYGYVDEKYQPVKIVMQ